MENTQKGFAAIVFIGIVVVLIAAGAGVWYYSKTAITPAVVSTPPSKTAATAETRKLESKEYQLTGEPGNLAKVDGPITVVEIKNCAVPDLSEKCPETSFIGKQNCNSINHAPADCAYDGKIAKKSQACIYQEFGGVAAGTEVSGYDGLVVRDSRCFIVHWETFNRTECMETGDRKCLTVDLQNGDQMLSTFKFIDVVSRGDGAVAYSMEKNGRGFVFPKITGFEDENIKNKVNAKLKENADYFCECDDLGGLTGCQVDAKVTYASNYIFSVQLFYNWSCEKELHDARGFDSYVFDMKTGQIVGFGDVFGLPANRLVQQISDGLADVIYRNVKNIDKCPEAYELEDIKNYSYSYSIADKEVVFTPNISYAGLVCAEDIIVPVAEAAQFAKPNSILERIAY